ncbi:MAG: O-antigen ligase family protein [Deltaproteobacteria bacterium]
MREFLLRYRDIIGFGIVGLALAYVLKTFIGVKFTVLLMGALVAVPVAVFLSLQKWRLLSYFFFVWLLLEGVFRKWVLPEMATALFFVKHLLLAGPYFYMFTRGIKVSRAYYPFLGIVLAYVLWGALESLNFRVTTNFRVQALGFITHFYFVPLIFLIPMLLDSQERILRFLKMIPYLSIPVFMLGVVQYYSPSTSAINKYVDKDAHVAGIGEFVRITGVFSYISPFNTYIGISIALILYLIVIVRGVNKRETLVIYIAFALGMANLFMTGSRGAVAAFILQAAPFLFFALRGRVRIRKKVIARLLLAMPLMIALLIFSETGSRAVEAFVERTRSVSSDVVPRIIDNFTPFKFLSESGLAGFGIGTAYQGAFNLVENWKDMPREFEEEWERLVLELGLIGFVIIMALRFYIIFYSFKIWRRIKTYELKILALTIFLHQCLILTGLNIVYNPLQNIIFWSLVGLLVAVVRINRINEFEAQHSSVSSG